VVLEAFYEVFLMLCFYKLSGKQKFNLLFEIKALRIVSYEVIKSMAYRRIITIAILQFAITISKAFFPPEHYRNVYNDDFPADYDPDSGRPTFDGIYERRDNFDVETPMEYPSESKPESEELNDDQLHASDGSDYPLYAPEGNEEYSPSESQTDSSSSFLSDGCLRCICEV
jgi:hypothetical protein